MFDRLAEEFPRSAVSWRAQTVTKDGTKALALAYIDARDVMERLDSVCGPGGWQDRYEFSGPRTICYLSIRVGDEWITKADGAGDTAVEAEKGAISDAFKRAAVKWGIGRYLYALDAPWVPCECSEFNGKKQWKGWAADPWKFVRGAPAPAAPPADKAAAPKHQIEAIDSLWGELSAIGTMAGLQSFWVDNQDAIKRMDEVNFKRFTDKKDALKRQFDKASNKTVADIGDAFPGAEIVDERIVSTLQAGE